MQKSKEEKENVSFNKLTEIQHSYKGQGLKGLMKSFGLVLEDMISH